jgi:chorismate-pyruvate lyase
MDFAERSGVLRRFDGTFTSVLSGLHGEGIVARVVATERRPASRLESALLEDDDEVVVRSASLVGQVTGTAHAFAESVFAVKRLALLSTTGEADCPDPIGEVLRHRGVATFRRDVSFDLATTHFARSWMPATAGELYAVKTSLLVSNDGPLVLLTEVFLADMSLMTMDRGVGDAY